MTATTFLDQLVSAVRLVRLKGKGFVLDFVTPREGTHRVAVAGSYTMTLDLANVIHRQIYIGCFARKMTRWAQVLLPPGGTFLDVGAHVGYFSLIAAHRVGREGRVYAMEPNPAPFAYLQANLAANHIGHVDAHMLCLAERDGLMRLHVPAPIAYRDYNATLLPRTDWQSVDVPTKRLDDCLRNWDVNRVDLMKIDVEGSEPRVLAGGVSHLTRGVVRHLMIEINGPRLVEGGSSPTALVRQLDALGFTPARLARGRAIASPPNTLDLDPAYESDQLFVHRAAQR